MLCATDFDHEKRPLYSNRMPELVVEFGICQCQHCTVRAFVELHNRPLLLELLPYPKHSES